MRILVRQGKHCRSNFDYSHAKPLSGRMVHNIFQVKPIMEWFSTAAAAAVIDKKFEALPETFEVKTYWICSNTHFLYTVTK